ncbi:hypothetical protein ABVT39_027909 [Epinephelus coioides]
MKEQEWLENRGESLNYSHNLRPLAGCHARLILHDGALASDSLQDDERTVHSVRELRGFTSSLYVSLHMGCLLLNGSTPNNEQEAGGGEVKKGEGKKEKMKQKMGKQDSEGVEVKTNCRRLED